LGSVESASYARTNFATQARLFNIKEQVPPEPVSLETMVDLDGAELQLLRSEHRYARRGLGQFQALIWGGSGDDQRWHHGTPGWGSGRCVGALRFDRAVGDPAGSRVTIIWNAIALVGLELC
jgi:hypothetical protein